VEVERREYEGLVAKDESSLYAGGRTLSWLKVKQPEYRYPKCRPSLTRYNGDQRSDDKLRAGIHAPLADQTLPPVNGCSWAGNGNGVNQCVCCGETIGSSDQEFGPRSAAGRYAHADCFNLWREESSLLKGCGQPSDAH
jgi:hypothetical protein